MDILLNRKVAVKAKPKYYEPVKNDEIDEFLAEFINNRGIFLPWWKRISQGLYFYGSKKVMVKYLRNHLVCKVGGGSMSIEEFVANYEDLEMMKINS